MKKDCIIKTVAATIIFSLFSFWLTSGLHEISFFLNNYVLFYFILVLHFACALGLASAAIKALNKYFIGFGHFKGLLRCAGWFGAATAVAVVLFAISTSYEKYESSRAYLLYLVMLVLPLAIIFATSAICILASLWRQKSPKSFKAVSTLIFSIMTVIPWVLIVSFITLYNNSSNADRYTVNYATHIVYQGQYYTILILSCVLLSVLSALFCLGLYKKKLNYGIAKRLLALLLVFASVSFVIIGAVEYYSDTEKFESITDAYKAELAIPLLGLDSDGVICVGSESDGSKIYIARRESYRSFLVERFGSYTNYLKYSRPKEFASVKVFKIYAKELLN